MRRSLRLVLMLGLVGALALGSVASTAAGGRKVLDATMTGIPVGGMALFGIAGGGVPWIIEDGRAKIFADGRLRVEVEGLTLLNGTNPIRSGRAILTCAGAPAASTDAVFFSPEGDTVVDAVVSLPDPCLAPAVFFAGVTGAGDRWFAVTGF